LVSKQECWSQDETYANLSYILSLPDGKKLIQQYLKMFGIDEQESAKKYAIK
jgi:hypothetical protein